GERTYIKNHRVADSPLFQLSYCSMALIFEQGQRLGLSLGPHPFFGCLTSVKRFPCAAAEPARPPPAPRSNHAAPTARTAPTSGPATYTQKLVKSVATKFGPNVRAGFIDAPEIGLPHSPASAMYAPTPIAPKIPMFCAPDAVPRMTLTSPRVSTVSIRNASPAEKPGAGWFEPYVAETPITHRRKRHASVAPANWTTTYPGTRRQGKS